MDDGTLAIIKAVRAVLVADSGLSGVDVYAFEAPRTASNPHILLSVPSNHRQGALGRNISFRNVRVAVKAVALESAGVSGFKTARTKADRALDLLTNVVSATTPETRLNAHLTGWAAMVPLEDGAIGPFTDRIPGEADDTRSVRWHAGNYIRFGLTPA